MAGQHVKGVARVTVRRPGRPVLHYVYAWRGGPLILRAEGGPPPALDDAALAKLAQARQGRSTEAADTLGGLAAEWRASVAWANFAPATRREWGRKLDNVLAYAPKGRRWGDVPLAVFDERGVRRAIIAFRDSMAEHPRKADYHVQVLRGLLAFGRVTGRLAVNMAEGTPLLYRGGQRQTILWEPDECERWRHAAVQVADAAILARYTGLRRADLVALPLSAVGEHAIVWRTSKSRGERVVSIPMIPELAAHVAELRTRTRAEGVQTLLVNSRGRPWTPDGLNASFEDERAKLGLPAKHLHDFRGTYVTVLCLAGLTDAEIGGIVGWSPANVAEVRRLYVDQARTVVAISERLAERSAKQIAKQAEN